ncbi:hypothetical protein [Listeria monocytogenes]|uniref:hypothetical protein n=1 Tax=Listeria monocytogenes TaxID=1639 RepID=UPI000BDEEADA|nr:hypothetical protein [Listeria monocytogenes]PCX66801.1 hypothetical protein A4Q85_10980 [Listeria monocytogenes]PDQ41274.1 hypothetical protein A0I89_06505 [Listeria monocytogenes]PDQ52189.1 hypothetical protein A0I87_10575 [Listeria monocytogenes]
MKVELDFSGFIEIDTLIKLENINICAGCGGIGTIKTLVGYARYDAYALAKKEYTECPKCKGTGYSQNGRL